MKKFITILISSFICYNLFGVHIHSPVKYIETTESYYIFSKQDLIKKGFTENELQNYNDIILVKGTTANYSCSCSKILSSTIYQLLRNADEAEEKIYKQCTVKTMFVYIFSVIFVAIIILLLIFSAVIIFDTDYIRKPYVKS